MALMKLRLHFLFTDLSQHFGIYLKAVVHEFLINFMGLELIYLKSSMNLNQKLFGHITDQKIVLATAPKM